MPVIRRWSWVILTVLILWVAPAWAITSDELLRQVAQSAGCSILSVQYMTSSWLDGSKMAKPQWVVVYGEGCTTEQMQRGEAAKIRFGRAPD
jgi:hypothetical protein